MENFRTRIVKITKNPAKSQKNGRISDFLQYISYFLHLRRSGAIRIRRKDAIRIRRRAARTSVRPTCLTRPTHASSRPACKSRPHDRTRPVKNTCTQPVQEHLFAQSGLL